MLTVQNLQNELINPLSIPTPIALGFVQGTKDLRQSLVGLSLIRGLDDAYKLIRTTTTRNVAAPIMKAGACSEKNKTTGRPVTPRDFTPRKIIEQIREYKRCDFEDVGIYRTPTAKEWNQNRLANYPEILEYIQKETTFFWNSEGLEMLKAIWFSHESEASYSALGIANFLGKRLAVTPNTEDRTSLVDGCFNQIAKAIIATRTVGDINASFGSAGLATDAVYDEIMKWVKRQASNLMMLQGNAYIHMTQTCFNNLCDTVAKKGDNTILLQQQAVSGSLWQLSTIQGIGIVVHPEWDDEIKNNDPTRKPNIMALLPMSDAILMLPREAGGADAGFGVVEDRTDTNEGEVTFRFVYSNYLVPMVSDLGEYMELSFAA